MYIAGLLNPFSMVQQWCQENECVCEWGGGHLSQGSRTHTCGLEMALKYSLSEGLGNESACLPLQAETSSSGSSLKYALHSLLDDKSERGCLWLFMDDKELVTHWWFPKWTAFDLFRWPFLEACKRWRTQTPRTPNHPPFPQSFFSFSSKWGLELLL